MYRITTFTLFMLVTYLVQAEAFLEIYPNKLNFENYPKITTTCVVKDMGDCEMIPKNVDKFNFSIIENGFYIKNVNFILKEQIDNDQVIVELSYQSMSPLYMHRDIVFHLQADEHFTYERQNYIFYNSGRIVDKELRTVEIDKHLSKYKQSTNQINTKPDPSLFTDKSMFECSLEELRIMRNHYYAQKGYIFKSNELTTYFKSQKWYTPTTTDIETMSFSDEEKAEIAYIKYYELLKSTTEDFVIDVVKYHDTDMIKEISFRTYRLYNSWDNSEKKQNVCINSAYISYSQSERQPEEIGFKNKYHKQEQYRRYHTNGKLEKELIIYNDYYLRLIENKYSDNGRVLQKQNYDDVDPHFVETQRKNWFMSKYIQKENVDTQHKTIYDLYQPRTPASWKEMNQIIEDSLKTNSSNKYQFDELKLLYEANYPKSKQLELDAGDYIKGNDSEYIHSPGLYNYFDTQLLIEKHEVRYVYVSMSNEKYERKLYDERPFFLGSKQGMLYDDSPVQQTDGKYKIQNWNWEQEKLELIEFFHPDMNFGTYIVFIKITFPEHKKTLYSEKYKLEYVPIEKE